MRAEGLPARRHDGGELQRRAAQDDALPRREGRAHARGARRAAACSRRRSSSPRRTAGSCAGSSRTRRTRTCTPHHRAGDPRRLRGRSARLLGHRLRNRRHAQGRRARAAEKRPATQIVVCEPDNAPMLGSGIPQPRAADGSPAGSHPLFRPHLMQGWTPDFIPKLTEDAVATKLVDRIVPVNGGDALRSRASSRRRKASSSASRAARRFAGALEVCESAPAGRERALHAARHGERYLSARRCSPTFRPT